MEERMFGQYRAGNYIGIPGRVDVYKGVDASGADASIMTAPVRAAGDAERFAERAQSAAALQHPDVAKVREWGQEGDTYFVAQDWVQGVDMGAAVADGTMPTEHVAKIGAQAAAALSAAHGNGLIHGDMRTQDVIIKEGDDVTIVGFGAPGTADAFVLPQDAGPEAAHFLSPEQARGQAATAQSDIYGLGAVLYKAATGRLPFNADTGMAVAAMQADSLVEAPRQVNPNVPASLENVILKAMEKDPSRRYGSAEEMRQDLERVAQGAAVAPVAPLPEKKKGSFWPWMLVVVVILALIGAAYALGFFGGGVEVPDVVGQDIETATTTLEDAGFEVGDIEFDDTYDTAKFEDGQVTEQDPLAKANAKEGSEVDLVLAGSELAEVPDLNGMSESEAIVAIKDAGFELGEVRREVSDDVDSGFVMDQTPSAGTEAPEGSPVAIVVSEGQETVTVPNVIGLSQSDATAQLQAAGLETKVNEEYNASAPAGQVTAQSPDAGVTIDAGSRVTITVSKGEETVSMLNVVGMTENDAVDALEDLGLRVSVNEAPDDANVGKVIAQDPAANSTLSPGTRVTITVAVSS